MGANASNEKKVIISKSSSKNDEQSNFKQTDNGYYSVKNNMVCDEVICFSNNGLVNEKSRILLNEEAHDIF